MSTDDTSTITQIRLTARVDQTAPRPDRETNELALLAPGHVLQWKDVPEESRPFQSPAEEYAFSQFCFPEDRLRYRWQGLGFDAEITRIYAMPAPDRWRQQMQMIQDAGAMAPDITDPEFQKRIAGMSVMQLLSTLQQEQWLLDTRQEPEAVTELDEKTGQLTRKTEYRPARARETLTRMQTIKAINNEIRLATGQATAIVDINDNTGKTIMAQMREIVRSQLQANNADPELPEANREFSVQVVEGDVAEPAQARESAA